MPVIHRRVGAGFVVFRCAAFDDLLIVSLLDKRFSIAFFALNNALTRPACQLFRDEWQASDRDISHCEPVCRGITMQITRELFRYRELL
jgi:hypothetical protein